MRVSPRRILRIFCFGIVGLYLLGMALLGFAYWEATWDPAVRRADVALADWPRGAPPVTVLLVSDHACRRARHAARAAGEDR